MTRKRLVRQLLVIHLAIVAVALIASGWFASRWIEESDTRGQLNRLETTARLLASRTSPEFADSLAVLQGPAQQAAPATGIRITLVQADGRPLFDTDEDIALLDNHADRPEIIAAMAGDEGHSVRYSVSLARRMLYFAIPVR